VVHHDDVAEDVEVIFAAGLFKGALEDVARLWSIQIRQVVVAAEVDGVVLAGGLVTLEACRHGGIVDQLHVAWRDSWVARRNREVPYWHNSRGDPSSPRPFAAKVGSEGGWEWAGAVRAFARMPTLYLAF
jgi:hypothetical protein